MNRLNEKKLGTAPDNPGMGDIKDTTASPQEKQWMIRNNSRNSTKRYNKSVAADPVLHLTLPTKIYVTHATLIAQIQIQRECPLFIRRFSNWAFSSSMTERQNKHYDAQWHAKQWQQNSVTNQSKRQNWGEIRNQWGTLLVNFSFEYDYCHHQKPAPLAPNFDYDCGQLQRRQWCALITSCWIIWMATILFQQTKS